MSQTQALKIPKRDAVARKDCWDLSKLFSGPSEWEKDFEQLAQMQKTIPSFKGTLGTSVEQLKNCLDFKCSMDSFIERLEYYSFLRVAEDGALDESQGRQVGSQSPKDNENANGNDNVTTYPEGQTASKLSAIW